MLLTKRFFGFTDELTLCKIIISGSDALSFLQGQTTNCVKTLEVKGCHYNSLLNRSGKIEFFFLLSKISEQEFWIWIEEDKVTGCLQRLEKYLIAEDVALATTPKQSYYILCSAILDQKLDLGGHQFFYFQEEATIFSTLPKQFLDLPKLSTDEKNVLKIIRGFYSLDEHEVLFNETIAIKIAWNQNKGCFLGQEVVQKIYSRRGAAKFPYSLKSAKSITNHLEDVYLLDKKLQIYGIVNQQIFVMLPREFQLENLKVNLTIAKNLLEAQVFEIEFQPNIYDEAYHHAIELFSIESKNEEAIMWLKNLIKIKPNNPEYHESLGAIYGKLNQNEAAIEQMKIVANLLPDEVMPYTNMSLYAMKLGKIEEAEKYKEEATVRSFLKLGLEAKKKNELAQKNEQEKNELLKREKMFLDVLEIDEFDPMALCGLAEIELSRNQVVSAKDKLEKLLKHNEKYTQAYIYLGRCFEAQGQLHLAKSAWSQGIELALSKGELMPAQQMQGLLLKHSS